MALSVGLLRSRDFRLLLLSRMFTVMALQAQAIIVGWQVYSLTHDPFMLGLTGLTEALPAIVCSLVSGHLVDNNRPHFIFLCCLGALVLNTLLLFLIGGGIITAPTAHILPFIYAGVFISGVARSFAWPAAFSLVTQLAARSQMASASGWLNSGFQFAAVSGPAIAGLIYGGYGARVAWMLPMMAMTVSFIFMASMGHEPRKWRNRAEREPAVQSILAGWRFIFHNRILLSVMALDMFAVLFGGAVAMLPAYADRILHVGAHGLGMLRAAPAIGAIISALVLAMRPMKRIATRRLMLVIVGFGFCMIGFGLSTSFALSLAFLAISGLFDSVSVIIRSTLMQLLAPNEMRGRVSAVNSMFVISSNEIGAFESGAAAAMFGLVPSVVIGGIGTLVVVSLTAILSPKMLTTTVDAGDVTSG